MLTLMTVSFSTTMLFLMPRWKWTALMCTFSIVSFLAMKLKKKEMLTWNSISYNFGTDFVSTPLIILSCWLAPLCFLAKKKIKSKNKILKKTFLLTISMMMFFLILTFSSLKMLSFFICFEATLIPTLILMTRWGKKMERLQAGMYFMFYTLSGSLPLLASLLMMFSNKKSMKITTMKLKLSNLSLFTMKTWWLITMMAFLMKMPMYGFHLWLPKAHVEAPMSGSMILAAMLLKLGGYGLIRLKTMFPKNLTLSNILIILCCLGALMTSIICLRQTDLKSLMAYSSVGHMSLVAAGTMMFKTWTMKGAMMLMIAHGLTSSALFALANMTYERTHTRNIYITQGFKTLTSLLPLWWLMFCAAKLGLPPLPNLVGEMFMMSSTMSWNPWLMPMLGITTVFSAVYSLSMFQSTNTKKKMFKFKTFLKIKPREHMMIYFHLLPLLLLIFNPKSCTM